MPDSPPPQHEVVFLPSGRRGRCPDGTTVLEAAQSLGVDLDSVCGGRALCGHCEVDVVEGTFRGVGTGSCRAHLSPPAEAEREFLGTRRRKGSRRLACRSRILGDVAIEVPPESQLHRQVVRKPCEARDIDVRPVIRAYLVAVDPPGAAVSGSDLDRLRTALARDWNVEAITCDPVVLAGLQAALRAGGWQVTVAVRDGSQLAGIWPGLKDRLYGVSMDVGSTTLAAQLCDLFSGDLLAEAGRLNPQIRFGEDLMSRVSYCMSRPDGRSAMTAAVREAANELVAELATSAGCDRQDILELTFVGNSIMHHLLLGWDPTELGRAPFTLASDEPVEVPARDLGLDIHPAGRAYLLPCIAGHIGADMAGVLLAESPWERDDMTLVIDVGTNAELALGNRHRLLVASSPTGPAFEGAHIGAGQRAAPGAIERVRIDPSTLEPRYKVIGCGPWSDEPGFAAALPVGGVTGICGSGIIEAIAELFLAGVIGADGRIRGDRAAESTRLIGRGAGFDYVLVPGTPGLRIEQADVRAIQLAKAALHAGAQLLMNSLGVERVDRIRLAGAFGAQIDVRYAMILGMLPDCPLDRVTSAGNAAGTGARIALLDREARSLIARQARRVERVETATASEFQQLFVDALSIPHAVDPYPALRETVPLPPAAPDRHRGARR